MVIIKPTITINERPRATISRALFETKTSLRFLGVMMLFGFMLSYSSFTSVMLHQISSALEGAQTSEVKRGLKASIDTTIAPAKEDSPWRLCIENPYKSALADSLEVIAQRADAWLDTLPDKREQARNDTLYGNFDHARFFPFDNMTSCTTMDCVGGPCSHDLSKVVCGLPELQKQQSCVIYSIGGNNQWDFELALLEKTPCEIHTFDCTGPLGRFHKPQNDRLHFHHICIGTEHSNGGACVNRRRDRGMCGPTWTLNEIQQHLKHDRIDLFKADVEGWEWPLLNSWPLLTEVEMSQNTTLPMQILVEVHYKSKIEADKPAIDIVELQARFLRMGYIVAVRDDNPYCKHCTELTLLRNRCPAQTYLQQPSSSLQVAA